MPLLLESLSSLVFCFISFSVYFIVPMLLFLVFSWSFSCLVVLRLFDKLGYVTSL